MADERVIRLTAESRQDGSWYVSSPDVPLLHVAIESPDEIASVVLPLLKETLERKLGHSVELRLVRVFEEWSPEDSAVHTLPSHVIAELRSSRP